MNRKLFIVLMVMTLAMQPGCNKNDNPKESLPAVLARLDWGEGTTYVIGHKTPDADAVFSAMDRSTGKPPSSPTNGASTSRPSCRLSNRAPA